MLKNLTTIRSASMKLSTAVRRHVIFHAAATGDAAHPFGGMWDWAEGWSSVAYAAVTARTD